MENQIKELEALVILLARRITDVEKKAGLSHSLGLSDTQLLEQMKKDAQKHLKNL